MFRLLLVRHGETQANLEHRCVGRWDVPLTEIGQQQAVLVAQRLADRPFDAVYASDLQRAWDTVQTIMASRDGSTPLIREPRLREYNKGEWQGLTWDDIRANRAEEYCRWRADRDQAPPGGEKLSEVVVRMSSVLDDARRAHPDGDVLFIGHGTSFRVLICSVMGLNPNLAWSMNTGNTSLSELHFYPESPVLYCLNDTGHLDRS